ncbi:hypothetical protein RFI_27652 [Reticulomyxa filosa]|uniref:F-box domain-containing protein n=1 Tax=Reticulomyxa filosa TaxID=46433 RepID=X6M6V5_RETFI|nr:hypothetical protein RFI_27652 [Reticulomyxa filosa]|eukprot:ETO09723.1 hypothetical protein RFI_27652 [Reticulomyxa filosa]
MSFQSQLQQYRLQQQEKYNRRQTNQPSWVLAKASPFVIKTKRQNKENDEKTSFPRMLPVKRITLLDIPTHVLCHVLRFLNFEAVCKVIPQVHRDLKQLCLEPLSIDQVCINQRFVRRFLSPQISLQDKKERMNWESVKMELASLTAKNLLELYKESLPDDSNIEKDSSKFPKWSVSYRVWDQEKILPERVRETVDKITAFVEGKEEDAPELLREMINIDPLVKSARDDLWRFQHVKLIEFDSECYQATFFWEICLLSAAWRFAPNLSQFAPKKNRERAITRSILEYWKAPTYRVPTKKSLQGKKKKCNGVIYYINICTYMYKGAKAYELMCTLLQQTQIRVPTFVINATFDMTHSLTQICEPIALAQELVVKTNTLPFSINLCTHLLRLSCWQWSTITQVTALSFFNGLQELVLDLSSPQTFTSNSKIFFQSLETLKIYYRFAVKFDDVKSNVVHLLQMAPSLQTLIVNTSNEVVHSGDYLQLPARLIEDNLSWNKILETVITNDMNQLSCIETNVDAFGFLWHLKKCADATDSDSFGNSIALSSLRSLHVSFPAAIKVRSVLSALKECIVYNSYLFIEEMTVVFLEPVHLNIPFDLDRLYTFLEELFESDNRYLKRFSLQLEKVSELSTHFETISKAADEEKEDFDDKVFGVLKGFGESQLHQLYLQLPLSLDNVKYLHTVADFSQFSCHITRDHHLGLLLILLTKNNV